MIRLWDADTGQLVLEMQRSDNSVIALFHPDGNILAAGSSGFGPDYAVRLWDPHSGELRQTLEGHTTDIVVSLTCQCPTPRTCVDEAEPLEELAH